MPGVLSKQDILALVARKPPLIESYLNLEEQVQVNGFDMTLREIAMLEMCGQITVDNRRRQVSSLAPLVFDGTGFVDLMPGPYLVTFNEIVHLPKDLMALARPRSSLLRCGVSVHTAVWDAGYSGRSQALLTVYNPRGFRVERNARIVQMVFFLLAQETEGYKGVYQGENV